MIGLPARMFHVKDGEIVDQFGTIVSVPEAERLLGILTARFEATRAAGKEGLATWGDVENAATFAVGLEQAIDKAKTP